MSTTCYITPCIWLTRASAVCWTIYPSSSFVFFSNFFSTFPCSFCILRSPFNCLCVSAAFVPEDEVFSYRRLLEFDAENRCVVKTPSFSSVILDLDNSEVSWPKYALTASLDTCSEVVHGPKDYFSWSATFLDRFLSFLCFFLSFFSLSLIESGASWMVLTFR